MNPSTALATVLVDELVRGGVREAVLCPGSRSAPLAYALQEADRRGRLRLHVRVDERSAGFLALGLAKAPRRPVPVVTTSGTAVANLHPAVLEAGHAGVPLLVLSADRPPELRGTGANQTIDQAGLFGAAVRWSHELGAPERRAGQNGSWRVAGLPRACRGARGPDRRRRAGAPQRAAARAAGARRPTGAGWPDVARRARRRDALGATVPAARQPARRSAGVTWAPRTLVVVGDLPRRGMAAARSRSPRAAGWPVVAEPLRALGPRGRRARTAPLLLGAGAWLDAHRPERVLVVGRATLARPVAALLRRPGVRRRGGRGRRRLGRPGPRRVARPAVGLVAASRPAVDGCGDRRLGRRLAEAGRRVAKAVAEARPRRGRPARPWPPCSRPRCPPARPCSSGRPTRCATSTWPSDPAARRRDAGAGQPRAGRHRRHACRPPSGIALAAAGRRRRTR